MAYNTYIYVLFLAAALLFYYLVPKKYRWAELLIASYLYYFISSRQYTLFLLFSTVTVYVAGRQMGKWNERYNTEKKELEKTEKKKLKQKYEQKKKYLLIATVGVNLSILVFRKYFLFVTYNLDRLFEKLGIDIFVPQLNFVLPLGISFYTLQVIGYLIDVNRGTVKPEENFGKFALFTSFFPQMVEGPICRYGQTAEQLYTGHSFDYTKFMFGVQRFAWGLFKKMVIADRINALVNFIYLSYLRYSGVLILVVALAYTIQLYAEFSGCMDMVLGSAECFGIDLPENFAHPFAACTVQEYWRRWHITLGAWFKDYMFYAVSLSKPVKNISKRLKNWKNNSVTRCTSTLIALFVVWSFTGIWHGGSFRYLLYGWYYFVLIAAGVLFEPLAVKAAARLNIDREGKAFKVFRRCRTFIFINIGLMIFRAPTISQFLFMFRSIFRDFHPGVLVDGTLLELGLDKMDIIVLAVGILMMVVVGTLQVRGVKIRESIAGWKLPVRWCVYYVLVMSILVFGAYGQGYTAVPFVYAEF